MPAKNPRLTITLDPPLHAQLRRLSELTGNSQSKLISEILDGSIEVFARLIQVLEAAEKAKGQIKGKAAEDMKRAQHRMEAQFGLLLDDWDQGTTGLLTEVEKVTRRGRAPGLARDARAPGTDVSTPISNRGVRSTANPQEKAKQKGKTHGQV